MKNKKSIIPPAPIVCKLNNNPEKYKTHAVLFALVDLLIARKDVSVLEYFAYLNYYSDEQYRRFSTRISDKRNKELPVNQVYFIVFYSVMHLSVQLYKTERILRIIKATLSEKNLGDLDQSNQEFIVFCNAALAELQKNLKKNNALIIAMNKIDGSRISG